MVSPSTYYIVQTVSILFEVVHDSRVPQQEIWREPSANLPQCPRSVSVHCYQDFCEYMAYSLHYLYLEEDTWCLLLLIPTAKFYLLLKICNIIYK